MAALCKAGDPESGFMDLTCPDVSTRASNVTFSELFAAKSGNAFGEAIARTDLINFGGTIPVSSEGGTAETIAALLNGLGAERLSAMAATSGFSATAESAPESGADLASTAVSGTARVESFVYSRPSNLRRIVRGRARLSCRSHARLRRLAGSGGGARYLLRSYSSRMRAATWSGFGEKTFQQRQAGKQILVPRRACHDEHKRREK